MPSTIAFNERLSSGSKESGEPVEKRRGHAIEIGGPFVAAIERRHDNVRSRRAKPCLIVSEFLRRVPVVPFTAANQRFGNPRKRFRRELRRHVAAKRDDSGRLLAGGGGGAKRHCHAL